MYRLLAGVLALGMLPQIAHPDDQHSYPMFVSRSPALAFDFWSSLQNMRSKGVTITRDIADQVCRGMKAGSEPQCIRVEMFDPKPIASGWGGALALSDSGAKVWFHNPDTAGWVHPDYFVRYVNRPKNRDN